jgi:hypothetical protein
MLLGSFLVLVLGCGGRPPAIGDGDRRTFTTLDAFVDGYWDRPVPLQGPAPDSFAAIEASLYPSDCGTCHPIQYADWETSLHAQAYSPGLAGQLVNWEASDYKTVRLCLGCHAPLSEQAAQVSDASGELVENPSFARDLQHEGLSCAACHVRGWARYGPPRRDGSLEPYPPGAPHGGVIRTAFFEDSRFCATCHQFARPAPNGKSLQNTFVEWEQSRYGAAGIVCQICHMPGRRHLWRGIHDSATVAGGVTVEWVRPGAGVDGAIGLRVTNSGVGHRFPTYVTPKIRVRVQLLDASREPIDGAVAESVIGREANAKNGAWVEDWDTRLRPDSSLTIDISLVPQARFARGTITVFPDGFYSGMFSRMLAGKLSDTSRALISEAHQRTVESVYSIFDATTQVR